MEPNFWHQKWESNSIAFHEQSTNRLLIDYFNKLSVSHNGRVFVPLCGKTRDIAWLLSKGYRVVGVELSELAIEQLFVDLGLEPVVSDVGPLKLYKAPDIEIFAGDFFDLSPEMLGSVEAVFDRAAFVALPPDLRLRYSKRLMELTSHAPQLLITLEYDQALMTGPPFSLREDVVVHHYQSSYDLIPLAALDVNAPLKGRVEAQEKAWLLCPLSST